MLCWGESKWRKNKGKQREACFLWVNLQDFQPGQKENTRQLFLTRVKLTNGPDFPIPRHFVPYAPESYCLALTWGRKKPNKKTNTHSLCFRTLQGSPVAARSRRALPICLACNFKRIRRSGFVPVKKNVAWKETCQDQWRDGTFFPLFPLQPCFVGRGIWDAVLKGRLEDHIMLENLEGLHRSSSKSSF